jgi:amidohydrolase
MRISSEIEALHDELIALRRDFHRHPELGLEEYRTSEKVTAYLTNLGLEVSHANKTGVVGLLRGGSPGPTLLLRADMDALPIQEENDLPYRSANSGVMHACGHDAHTAMLMVAARILSCRKDELRGNIKFVFQPNEENVGALAMIEEGIMADPHVDACAGIHIWTPLPSGQVGISAGPVMAGMEHFKLVIKGRGGHTATPQSAIDPILTAADVIQSVQMIQTREIDALHEPTVIMFGQVMGGTASNIIPDDVSLAGTLRYLFKGDADSEESPKKKFQRIVTHICSAHRADHELEFEFGHPTLVNHSEMAALAQQVASGEMQNTVEVVPLVSLAGEDFSEFAVRVPGVFYFLGTGNPAKETDFPHHHSRFDIDEDVLRTGVELHVRLAFEFFRNADQFTFIN